MEAVQIFTDVTFGINLVVLHGFIWLWRDGFGGFTGEPVLTENLSHII